LLPILCTAAMTMTPFKRGVSDLGCGRGHDRRRGQISWSLTPPSTRWCGDDHGEVERSQQTPTAWARREAAIAHLLAAADRLACTPAGSNQTGGRPFHAEGNTPRGALFPFAFPWKSRSHDYYGRGGSGDSRRATGAGMAVVEVHPEPSTGHGSRDSYSIAT
jgi:hypothetical protein